MVEDESAKRVTKHEDAGWGSFSPDGSKIAYGCCGDRPGPYGMSADGGTPRPLGHPCRRVEEGLPSGGAICGEPLEEAAAWSPLGSPIAWVDFEEYNARYGHHAYVLSFVNPDGTGVRTEVAPLPGGTGLVWSPDGSGLAFWQSDDSDRPGQIFVINADGSHLRRLTRHGDNRWPAWSPDGSRLAFVHDDRLFTMAVDGSHVRRVPGARLDGPIARAPAS